MARQQLAVLTKQDETRQVIEVRPEQDQALMILLRGGTDQEAADAAGVSRQTVSGWIHSDAVFLAEFNRRRVLVWGAYQDRLRALVVEALDVLGAQLRSGDPAVQRQVALTILKTAGDMTGGIGATDPDRIKLEWSKAKPTALDWMVADY